VPDSANNGAREGGVEIIQRHDNQKTDNQRLNQEKCKYGTDGKREPYELAGMIQMLQMCSNPDQSFAHEYNFTDHQKEGQDETSHDRNIQFDIHSFPFRMMIGNRDELTGSFL
jgi:hypothetical protein